MALERTYTALDQELEKLQSELRSEEHLAKHMVVYAEDENLGPMASETYSQILSLRGSRHEQASSSEASSSEDEQYDLHELYLHHDLSAGKVRWYGAWHNDMWLFQKNNHPGCALLYSHPLFPVSRREFYLIFGFNVFFTMVLSCLHSVTETCIDCGLACSGGDESCYWTDMRRMIDEEVPDWLVWLEHPNATAERPWSLLPGVTAVIQKPHKFLCCVGHASGMAWFIRHDLGSIYIILANIMYMIIFFQLFQCGPVQKWKYTQRHLVELLGKACATILIVSFFWFTMVPCATYLYANGTGPHVLLRVIWTKLWSWVGVFFIKLALFHVLYIREAADAEQGPSRFHISAEDYNDFLEQVER